MINPELRDTGIDPGAVLMEAFDVTSKIGYPYFLHDRSENGHMFDTGNYGGPEKYFANDAYRTPIPFDFTEFDNYHGESTIEASLFSINNRCLVSFFNIERDNGERFTYGLMMGYDSNSDITELTQGPEDGGFGKPAEQENGFRQPVYRWLVSYPT